MYALNRLRVLGLIFPILVSVVIKPCLAFEAAASSANSMTQEACDLLKQGKSEEALRLQRQSISLAPSSWLAHASMSYSLWHLGNIAEAISEGETATKLNPESAVSLVNLALLKQNSGAYPQAIALYERAAKLIPCNWVPPLGIARCSILCGDDSSGRKALIAMSKQNDCSFEWYYMTAKTCFDIYALDIAEKTASKAMSASSKQEQRSAAQNLLFLTLLRMGKFKKAQSMQEQVFHCNHPHEAELYVRASCALVPINDPSLGQTVLNCAIENLTSTQDANTFLKLGRVFENKAANQTHDSTCRATWLKIAQAAYTHATKLNPKSADYHLALAGIFNGEGLLKETANELKETMSLDRVDILSPFLLSKVLNPAVPEQEQPIRLNLSLVRFKIDGLTCACKLSKIHGALKSINGVAFISTPPHKPYEGLVLVDRSLTPTREMISQCNQNALLSGSEPKRPPRIAKIEMVSEVPVTTIDAALKIAQDIRFGPILSFKKTFSETVNRFKEITPIMPLNEIGTTEGIDPSSGWVAPL